MLVKISDTKAIRSVGEGKTTSSKQPPRQPCRHPSYELRPMPVPNTCRKFQQLVCTKCGFVAGTLDLHVDVQLDKIANALVRLVEKLGV
jgi:hypothetical protein